MNRIRSTCILFLALLAFVTGISVPRNAHAIIGIPAATAATGGLAGFGALMGGLAVTGLGVGAFYYGLQPATKDGTMLVWLGLCYIIGGLLILDSPGEVAFAALTENQAAALAITDEERDAYNSELDELNAVRQSVKSELDERAEKGEKITVGISKKAWLKHFAEVSPASFSAAQKIVRQMFKVAKPLPQR